MNFSVKVLEFSFDFPKRISSKIIQIHHIKSFKWNKTEFGLIKSNSTKHRNIEKFRIPRTQASFTVSKISVL